MNEAERSDKVGFMRRGKVLVESSPQALLAQYSVKTLDEVFYAVSLEDEKSNASRTVYQDNLFVRKKITKLQRGQRNNFALPLMKPCQSVYIVCATFFTYENSKYRYLGVGRYSIFFSINYLRT